MTIYNGNYADHKYELEQRLKQEKEADKLSKASIATSPIIAETKRKISFKEQQEYNNLERGIAELENAITEKTVELNNTTDHNKLVTISKEIENFQSQIDQKSERWLELAEYM